MGERPAGRTYTQAQELVFGDPGCDLLVYRLQLEQASHVAVLGEQPREGLEQRLQGILWTGEPASLPQTILRELARDQRDSP